MSRLSEFRTADSGLTLDPGSEHMLITLPKPDNANNHNGGNLAFGPDGFLYAGIGDGGGGERHGHGHGAFGNAQNTSTLFGKMLRIDISGTTGAVRYRIPPSNPFSSSTTLCNTNGTGHTALPGDLRDRAAQSLALELRPRERAALGRRRRPGCVGGSRPRGPRRQLRLALLRRHAHQHRVHLRDAGADQAPGRAVRPRRRRERDRRLCLPRHPLRRPRRSLHLRRLRRPRHDLQHRRHRAGRARNGGTASLPASPSRRSAKASTGSSSPSTTTAGSTTSASSRRPGSRASRDGGDGDEHHRRRGRFQPDRGVHRRRMRGRGRENVVTEGVEPERGVNGDEANADGEVSASQDAGSRRRRATFRRAMPRRPPAA